jgi:hypothetical protein
MREEFPVTVEPGRKLEPAIWICVSGEPAGTAEGLSEEIEGERLFTESDSEFEVPPPGVGLETVMAWVPASVALLAGSVALSPPVVTNVEASAFPSRLTDDALLKPEPASIKDVSADPTETLPGLRLLSEGAGYVSESCAELLFEVSTWLVAETVIALPFEGIGSGAV